MNYLSVIKFIDITNKEITALVLCVLLPIAFAVFFRLRYQGLLIRCITGLFILTTTAWILSFWQMDYEPVARTCFVCSLLLSASTVARLFNKWMPQADRNDPAVRRSERRFRLGMRWAVIPASILLGTGLMLYSIYQREIQAAITLKAQFERHRLETEREVASMKAEFAAILTEVDCKLEDIMSEVRYNGVSIHRQEAKGNARMKVLEKQSQDVQQLKRDFGRAVNRAQQSTPTPAPSKGRKNLKANDSFFDWLKGRFRTSGKELIRPPAEQLPDSMRLVKLPPPKIYLYVRYEPRPAIR